MADAAYAAAYIVTWLDNPAILLSAIVILGGVLAYALGARQRWVRWLWGTTATLLALLGIAIAAAMYVRTAGSPERNALTPGLYSRGAAFGMALALCSLLALQIWRRTAGRRTVIRFAVIVGFLVAGPVAASLPLEAARQATYLRAFEAGFFDASPAMRVVAAAYPDWWDGVRERALAAYVADQRPDMDAVIGPGRAHYHEVLGAGARAPTGPLLQWFRAQVDLLRQLAGENPALCGEIINVGTPRHLGRMSPASRALAEQALDAFADAYRQGRASPAAPVAAQIGEALMAAAVRLPGSEVSADEIDALGSPGPAQCTIGLKLFANFLAMPGESRGLAVRYWLADFVAGVGEALSVPGQARRFDRNNRAVVSRAFEAATGASAFDSRCYATPEHFPELAIVAHSQMEGGCILAGVFAHGRWQNLDDDGRLLDRLAPEILAAHGWARADAEARRTLATQWAAEVVYPEWGGASSDMAAPTSEALPDGSVVVRLWVTRWSIAVLREPVTVVIGTDGAPRH
jgi:hypothetical protein